jgi:cholesterol 7-desaturase
VRGYSCLHPDHDGKVLSLKSIEYSDDLGKKDCKHEFKEGAAEVPTLRKYPVVEMNTYIYIWIHALEEHQNKPEYPMLDISNFIRKLTYRGQTEHLISCHLQDIPSNGADVLHFKYVHTYIYSWLQSVYFRWAAKWKTADDPDIKELFEHSRDDAREFKQKIYRELIEPYPRKEILSVGYLDNWIRLPILGEYFMFSATIIQVGLGIVFVILKAPLYELVFHHYIRPIGRNEQQVFHDCFISPWVPRAISSKIVELEGGQVTNDMYIWEAKSFARKTFLNEERDSDRIMKDWLKWSGQFYQGCGSQQEKDKFSW